MARYVESVPQIHKAAGLCTSVAMFDMVRYYTEGLGVEKSVAESFRWMKQATENGHLLAMREMIEIFLEGCYGQTPDDASSGAAGIFVPKSSQKLIGAYQFAHIVLGNNCQTGFTKILVSARMIEMPMRIQDKADQLFGNFPDGL